MKYYLPKDDNLGSNLGSNLGNIPISKIRKKRLSRDEIRAEITSVCSDWVSLDYIAVSIERNPDYLLSDVIPSMLEEGLIERMYPESPRSPYQKYRKKG